ncbi:MAG: hypothetical protein FIA97_07965, partial [Methylococcaceae bacterium]|nr:hypothetical protein [Methylococcaceae bacterium]
MTKKTALSTAVSIALGTVATIGGFNLAHAGVGYGVTTDPGFTTAGNPAYPDYTMPTFYANSELPKVVNGAVTGGLHKFVDTLAPLGCGTTNNLGQCIPIAVPNTAYQVNGADPFPGADYYEIGIVEYREQMHSDLPAAGTLLRGYVQLVPAGTSGAVALTEADGAPLTRIINGVPTQLYGATKPHYLGPIIVATKGVPVRVKYTNLLPIGAATNAAGTGPVVSGPVTGPDGAVYNKVSDFKRNGDLFIPTDTTLTGAGLGPDGATWYQQNRAELHLHGGLTPWISDGTPHQWTVPLNDPISLRTTPADDISGPTGIAGANVANIYGVGASFVNVPDMADPGQGSGTLYWTNDQSARLMFYHDHVSGITRLNVYVGEAAGYVLTDNVENALLNGDATLGINQALPGGVLDQIPLVIQDKTFVPSDIAMQDAKWDTTAWGQTGDLWFPHVYETNQDPASADGTNPVGRWDWGPWFWPVFNAQFGLPSGEYGDVTTTPEAFMDTPVVNGTAYPSLTVEPKAYRFRVLNAANDRMVNLGLYVAEPLSIGVADPGPGGYVDPRVVISGGGGSGATADALMGLQSITFADGTNTYTVPPPVAISAPPAGGIQATAIAVLQQTAINQPVALKEILITNPGDGYTTPPQITVTANSVDATSTAKTTISASATVGLAGIKVTNAGNYGQSGTTAPTITITEGPNGPTLPVVAVASVNTEVKMVP